MNDERENARLLLLELDSSNTAIIVIKTAMFLYLPLMLAMLVTLLNKDMGNLIFWFSIFTGPLIVIFICVLELRLKILTKFINSKNVKDHFINL